MTPPTRGFVRTARAAVFLGLAFAAGLVVRGAFVPAVPQTLHISGDGADQLAEGLFVWRGPDRAADPAFADMQVIALRRWQNLDGLTDLRRLCGVACNGEAPVVLLRRPSLNGMTKVLFIDMGAHGAGSMLDRGEPIPEYLLSCIVQEIWLQWRDEGWKITKCDVQESVDVWRPRLWTPQPPWPGILRGL
ncbi:hypothetical protein [Jannaschia pohangensis]|uniref:Uncharacterized protein n=1 Tax=Jannaschia pohangensis TaxID=390807 RepID=A0A1I3QND2_9RHOB|nr:hypothetical protein [Jannaschia pohangensis]SFJ35029.1 hypothetical protein SAMN04488095_2596 [Jannaschia pohangensis]